MKPRPFFSAFPANAAPRGAFANLQCHRHVHVQAIAPALRLHSRQNGSQRILQHGLLSMKGQHQMRRHASTSQAAARKSSYGSARAPLPTAKTQTSKVPAKASRPSVLVQPAYSSRLTPVAKSTAPRSNLPTLKAKEQLNPPSFTYAPEISVPARKADQNVAKWLWSAGRAYLTFYKTGISHVRQTSKLAKSLRAKAEQDGPGKDLSEVLTRAEWQIVLRSRKDTLRLPAMGVLILVLGEWLPLVVMYITPLVPEACRIPQQVKRDLAKQEKRRADRLRRVSLDAMRLQMQDKRPVGSGLNIDMTAFEKNAKVKPPSGQISKNMKAENMTLFELMLFSATHDCHLRVWDWLHLTPPKALLQRTVGEKLEYLRKDDALIERDGGWAALGKEEVERACVERGINVVGKKEEELRKALAVYRGAGKL
ncbi:hypothetical protein ACN47E_001403 [Coniothyrium glycines]